MPPTSSCQEAWRSRVRPDRVPASIYISLLRPAAPLSYNALARDKPCPLKRREFLFIRPRITLKLSCQTVPKELPEDLIAPLLCAGVTTFAPIQRNAKPGYKCGIIGIGGLGHVILQMVRLLQPRFTRELLLAHGVLLFWGWRVACHRQIIATKLTMGTFFLT